MVLYIVRSTVISTTTICANNKEDIEIVEVLLALLPQLLLFIVVVEKTGSCVCCFKFAFAHYIFNDM